MIGSSGKPRLVCIVNRPVISRHYHRTPWRSVIALKAVARIVNWCRTWLVTHLEGKILCTQLPFARTDCTLVGIWQVDNTSYTQSPLYRFVVDLLYAATYPRQIEVMEPWFNGQKSHMCVCVCARARLLCRLMRNSASSRKLTERWRFI